MHYVNETIRQRSKNLDAELRLLEPLAERLLSIGKLAQQGQGERSLYIYIYIYINIQTHTLRLSETREKKCISAVH